MNIGVILVIGVILILVVVLAYLIIWNNMQKRVKRNNKRLKIRKTKQGLIPTTRWLKWYTSLDRNFLTRQSVRKLNSRLMELGIFDHIASRIQATKVFLLSVVLMAGLFLFGLFAFHDLFMAMVFLTVAIVTKDTILKKNIDRYYFLMLEQLSEAISELRQAYLRSSSVSESLGEIVVGPLLVRQFSNLAEIMNAENAEEKLEEFFQTSPIKVLQTLAGICFAVENGGDTILANGASNFITSLSYITTEINLEIRKLRLQKAEFGSLEFLPIFPLILLPLLSGFMGNTIPGTKMIYNGTFGYVARLVIVGTAMASYMVISRINSAVAVQFDDRPQYLNKLLNQKKWRRAVRMILPQNMKTLTKKVAAIRGSLSRLTVEHLYLSKLFYAVAGFLITLILLLSAIYLGRAFESANIERASLMQVAPYSLEEEEKIRQLDKYYLKTTEMSEDELREELKNVLPRLKEERQEEEIQRMVKKRDKLSQPGFMFWHLWICIAVMCVCWNIPEFQLKFRRWLIKSESEEDCLQLQTVISILMNTSMDTLELLDWLAKHSRVHNHILIDALHEYASDPDLALMRLKQRAALPEFKRIIDKLMLTVSQVSIAEAFSDLAQERDHLIRMREIAQTESIKKKRARMSPVAQLSIGEVLFLYFIGPVALVAATEFATIFSGLPL